MPPAPSQDDAETHPAQASPGQVVLLHGLGRSPASMWLIARRLRRDGFRVHQIGYPSTRQTFAEAEGFVRHRLAELPPGPLSLVGHSLGGLIAAEILRAPRGLAIDRVVQLGSPNRGSPLITRLGWLWPVRMACGPILGELNTLPAPPGRSDSIAAIGGTASWPVISAGFLRPNDGVVTLRSAWSGAGHRGHVHMLHSFLLISPRAIAMTAAFLSTGRLEPS
ncbi:MAG: alpha/beta fold hydrolase [Pseudomonadota bacterium]